MTTDIDVLMLAATLASLALAVLWWLYLRPRAALRREEARPSRPERVALLVCALLALGMVLQVTISCTLSLVLPLFPEVMEGYLELMELAGISDEMSLATLVQVAVIAPIAEESLCRGVALEFSLRALCPGWRPASRPEAPDVRFWAANAIQALVFGVMHLNVVQGVYAFALGLLPGWVFRRTGRLRAAVLLHMAVNASSALMDSLGLLPFGSLEMMLVVGVIAAAAPILLAARLTRPGHEAPAFSPFA